MVIRLVSFRKFLLRSCDRISRQSAWYEMISGRPSATCQTGQPAMLPNAANPPCSHSPQNRISGALDFFDPRFKKIDNTTRFMLVMNTFSKPLEPSFRQGVTILPTQNMHYYIYYKGKPSENSGDSFMYPYQRTPCEIPNKGPI